MERSKFNLRSARATIAHAGVVCGYQQLQTREWIPTDPEEDKKIGASVPSWRESTTHETSVLTGTIRRGAQRFVHRFSAELSREATIIGRPPWEFLTV